MNSSEAKEKTQIMGIVNRIFKNYDKNGKEYLLLKLDKKDPIRADEDLAIFCFRLTERWGELNEGGNYNFEVLRTDRGTYLLETFTRL